MGRKTNYSKPPWDFSGRAIYQLHLVSSKEARKHIPPQLHLVSLFGYTLGGFYLARYTSSPVGAFDEFVALAGLVWNRPTSCAWAARVCVNNREARDHGKWHVGLPSCITSFKRTSEDDAPDWWQLDDEGRRGRKRRSRLHIAPAGDRPRWAWGKGAHSADMAPSCSLTLPASPASAWSPRLRLVLPSFSGFTKECPAMLRYACRLVTRVRLLQPMRVDTWEDSANTGLGWLLGSRPLVAFAFDDMHMKVNEPIVVREAVDGVQGYATGPCLSPA